MAPVTMPPGPTQRQLLSQIRGIQKDAPGFLLEIARQYGPLAFFKVGSLPVVIVSHPDGVRQILQDHNRQYSKDTIQYNALATITGRGLLTSDGDFWLRQRRLAQGAFSRSRLASLGEIIVPAVSAMLDRWEGFARRVEVLDVDQEMMRLALEIVGKALFGIDLSREAGNLTRAVLTALDHIIYRARNVIVPPDFLPTPRNLRFRAALRRLDQAVYAIIDERRAAPAAQDDLLGMLLAARDEETGEGMNNLQVRDEVITMLIAGHETVASALTWTWYLLARHPQVRSALHDEFMLLAASQPLRVVDLDQLPLAGQVFSEALRLYPPAWVITRKAIEFRRVIWIFHPIRFAGGPQSLCDTPPVRFLARARIIRPAAFFSRCCPGSQSFCLYSLRGWTAPVYRQSVCCHRSPDDFSADLAAFLA